MINLNPQSLNTALNNGLTPGQTAMVVIPTGGGKTTTACQLAGDLALTNKKVMLLTTEASQDELTQRILSNACNIDISCFWALGKKPSLLESARINSFCNLYGNNIRIAEVFDSLISDTLEHKLNELSATGFTPDIIIIDWVGNDTGSLPQSQINLTDIRNVYLNDAHVISKVAKSTGIPIIFFAQASLGLTEDVNVIDRTMIAECKELGDHIDYCIGVSAVSPGIHDAQLTATHSVYQTVNIWKTPHGVSPSTFKIKRQFQHQRWTDVTPADFQPEPYDTSHINTDYPDISKCKPVGASPYSRTYRQTAAVQAILEREFGFEWHDRNSPRQINRAMNRDHTVSVEKLLLMLPHFQVSLWDHLPHLKLGHDVNGLKRFIENFNQYFSTIVTLSQGYAV